MTNDNQGGAIYSKLIESKDPKFEHDKEETLVLDSKFNISFNAYSNDLSECNSKALKAWEWFKFKGYYYLAYNNIVVVNVSNIQDRTVNIVDNYEYRKGFDIELRALHKIKRTTETIEKYKIEGEIIA